MADAIKNNYADANVEFIKGSGGVFEVSKDGKNIYSKAKTGNFPDEKEIIELLK